MATRRVVKVFADEAQQEDLAAAYEQIERYESFIVLSTPLSAAKKIARAFLLEDITGEYAVRINGTELLSSKPYVKSTPGAEDRLNEVAAPSAGFHHYLVQFIGPIKEEWLKQVEKAGGRPREPLNGFVYIVRARKAAASKILALPCVRWVKHFDHIDRIAESVTRSLAQGPSGGPEQLPRRKVMKDVLTVAFFGPTEARAAAKAIPDFGLELLASDIKAALLTVRTRGTVKQQAAQLTAISALHGVRRIRERTLRRTSNDVSAGIMRTAASVGSAGLGLSGDGEIIGICDTGFDTGRAATIHADFQGRVAAVKSYPIGPILDTYITNPRANDGPSDVDSGHGTHVAGSVLGNGTAAGTLPGAPAIRGLAHKAQLVFQAVEQETKWKSIADERKFGRFGLWGLPDDLKSLFQFAYDKGVRIHSNSWGGGDAGAYDNQCRQVDQFVWDHKDLCLLFAAGNDGSDTDGDGKINPGSVSSPGTSKNCITVGACENNRADFNSQTYGRWWPQDFPAAPVKADPMANNPDQIVAFSSRGPTLDGRCKPDVVAPGTFVLSTRSTQLASNNFAWAAFPASSKYFHMGGTSMATPLTAGAVGLVREFLRKKKGIASPTAALLKATLVAGATRLSGQAPTTGSVCDNNQGFGRVNLDAVLSPVAPVRAKFTEVTPGLATGASWSQTIKVTASGSGLRIVLAYSDFPGSNLVNNLNLIVTSPTGKRFVGNQRTSGAAALDTRNNVEVVQENAAAAGDWNVRVVGSSIPKGPQDFAIVALGRVQ